MIGASKILTVSYGTFSCTLEGFDEPFSTMKAIAEYFRDLAAEDRYFGAVPPTPDAEMLHRIAEREIQRRVESKISEHGIVLRQAPEPATVAPAAATVQDAAPTIAAAPVAEAVTALKATRAADLPSVAKAPEVLVPEVLVPEVLAPVKAAAVAPLPAADDDSIAAKLARIRAAVSASTAAAAAPIAMANFDEAETEDEAEESLFLVDGSESSQSFSFDIDLPDISHLDVSHSADAHEPAIDLEAPPTTETQLVISAGAPETTAEDAETAEAEVKDAGVHAAGMADVAETDAGDLAQGDTADAETPVDVGWSEALTAALANDRAAAAEASDAAPLPTDAEADATTDDLVARFAHPEDDASDAPVHAAAGDAAPEPVTSDLSMSTWDDDADTTAMLVSDTPVDAGGHPDEVGLEDEAEQDLADLAALDAVPDDGAHDGAHDGVDDGVDEGADAGAAVMQAGADDDLTGAAEDADLDAAMIRDTLQDEAAEAVAGAGVSDYDEDYEDDVDMFGDVLVDDVAFEDDRTSGKTPQVAAEVDEPVAATPATAMSGAAGRPGLLSRARARVIKVRKTLDGVLADESTAPAADAVPGNERRAILENSAPDNDEGVSRLMDEAANKLEGAENRRRFSAISHLKAAVAATVADRKLKPQDVPAAPAADADDLSPYRDDLSKAVRPRRPVAEITSAPTTRRPAIEQRPAPLVLVSEQRVDTPDDFAADHSVRPRRISTSTMVLAEDEAEAEDEIDMPLSPEDVANFAEFADRLGATSLPELLEAAAAYTATVEGQPHFSRPQILRRVAHVTDEGDFTREDGLRSFGMLLRQGKIQKVRRGQFELSETSRFKSEARRVGQ